MREVGDHSAWYVVETLARAEFSAQCNLERQSFVTFCPQFKKTRRHARRVDHIQASVFPGYIFVRFDRNRDRWTSINGTTGVKRIVGPSSCHPQPMPEAVMDMLLARCKGNIISGLFSSLEPGQSVRLLSGPFADQIAHIERLDNPGRVRVLLNILGGQSSMAVSISNIGPL